MGSLPSASERPNLGSIREHLLAVRAADVTILDCGRNSVRQFSSIRVVGRQFSGGESSVGDVVRVGWVGVLIYGNSSGPVEWWH